MPLLLENGKEMYSCPWGKFLLEDIAIPWNIKAPPNLKEVDIPKYEMLDRPHYNAAQFHFFEDRRWLRGCEAHREIKEEELSEEIRDHLERHFRWCYFQKFKDNATKVRVLEKSGPVAA